LTLDTALYRLTETVFQRGVRIASVIIDEFIQELYRAGEWHGLLYHYPLIPEFFYSLRPLRDRQYSWHPEITAPFPDV
jgi:hypothetical protein